VDEHHERPSVEQHADALDAAATTTTRGVGMILKLGRIANGHIVETEFLCSQETAIAIMWAEQELAHTVQLFDQGGVDAIAMMGPPSVVARDQLVSNRWLTQGWNEYLASKPVSHNPRKYGRLTGGGALILPPGVKL
jgi:hypothetical protein